MSDNLQVQAELKLKDNLSKPASTALDAMGKSAAKTGTAVDAIGKGQSMLSGLSKSMAQAQAALAETLAPLQQAAAYVQGAVLTELRAILDVYDGTGAVVRSALSYIDYPVGFATDLLACQFSAASTVGGLSTFAGLSALSAVFPRVSLSADEPESTYAVGSSAYGSSCRHQE